MDNVSVMRLFLREPHRIDEVVIWYNAIDTKNATLYNVTSLSIKPSSFYRKVRALSECLRKASWWFQLRKFPIFLLRPFAGVWKSLLVFQPKRLRVLPLKPPTASLRSLLFDPISWERSEKRPYGSSFRLALPVLPWLPFRVRLLPWQSLPYSCLFLKLWVGINFLNMLIDCTNINIVQCGNHLLCQPYILIFISHLNTVLLITDRGNIGQVFCCTREDGYFILFLFQIECLLFIASHHNN